MKETKRKKRRCRLLISREGERERKAKGKISIRVSGAHLRDFGTVGGLGHDDLVDLEDGGGGIGGEFEGRMLADEGIKDVECDGITDLTGLDVDAKRCLALCVGGVEGGDDVGGIEARVFGEDAGNDFEGLCILFDGVLIEIGGGVTDGHQDAGQFQLRGSGSGQQSWISDQRLVDVDSVVFFAFLRQHRKEEMKRWREEEMKR